MRGLLVLSLAVAACTAARVARTTPPASDRGIEQLRRATSPFHDLDSAVAVGYPRLVRDCLVHEHHGAMGYHHANQRHLDARVEIGRPEILLYERHADGSYRLNGVEFIVPYRFWPRDSAPPTVFDQQLKREDNLNFWYLHAWVWKENPEGMFADFHPGIGCPDSARRVFRPFTRP